MVFTRCPYCSFDETRVVDKRDHEDSTRRRRECLKCNKRFTTYERAEVNLIVVKKDGTRERYDRNKLLTGIVKACEKRPISQETIEKIVDDIEAELRGYGREASSRDIGELVMDKLKKIDKVAYIRFASVYREFSDLAEFEKELRLLKASR